jgi:hypothetical protein
LATTLLRFACARLTQAAFSSSLACSGDMGSGSIMCKQNSAVDDEVRPFVVLLRGLLSPSPARQSSVPCGACQYFDCQSCSRWIANRVPQPPAFLQKDETVQIKLEEEVALTFALRYLNFFAKVRRLYSRFVSPPISVAKCVFPAVVPAGCLLLLFKSFMSSILGCV